jgi:hypothetical protein
VLYNVFKGGNENASHSNLPYQTLDQTQIQRALRFERYLDITAWDVRADKGVPGVELGRLNNMHGTQAAYHNSRHLGGRRTRHSNFKSPFLPRSVAGEVFFFRCALAALLVQ